MLRGTHPVSWLLQARERRQLAQRGRDRACEAFADAAHLRVPLSHARVAWVVLELRGGRRREDGHEGQEEERARAAARSLRGQPGGEHEQERAQGRHFL